MDERARVLVVEHETDAPAAWVGGWLEQAGAVLDVRRPYLGDPLPDDLSEHDAMVVLGGEMGANDDASCAWLAPTKALVRSAATAGPPVLGICLGHQLVSVALGGEAGVNPRGPMVGIVEVGWTAAAADDPLLGGLAARGAARGVHWNNDVVTRLPQGAVELARSPGGEVQAARLSPYVWGVQWHPEVGQQVVRAWADSSPGPDAERCVRKVGDAEAELRATWAPLAQAFAELCGASRPAANG